jgi:hypothetical protein
MCIIYPDRNFPGSGGSSMARKKIILHVGGVNRFYIFAL